MKKQWVFKSLRVLSTGVLGALMVAGVASAATTISTNISTDGTLAVTGASTLSSTLAVTGVSTFTGRAAMNGGASTTNLSASGAVWVGGNATTTSAGAISTQSTLTVTGLSSLNGAASTTNLSTSGAVWVGGNATTTSAGAISTNSTLTVGSAGTAASGIVFGYCTFATITIAASSTGMATCSGATGISSGDRIFVTATSSLPNNFIIQHASSTASNVIQVDLFNTGLNNAAVGATATGVNSLNFFAIR